MSLEDVAVVADGCENAALPLLVETQLGCGDRHCPGTACVPPRFRPLRADQSVHRPRDDCRPLRVVGAGRSHHWKGR